MAHVSKEKVTLEGDLTSTGNVAELVRWVTGKGTSLQSGLPYKPPSGVRRPCSSGHLTSRDGATAHPVNRSEAPSTAVPSGPQDLQHPERNCEYHERSLSTLGELDRYFNDKHDQPITALPPKPIEVHSSAATFDSEVFESLSNHQSCPVTSDSEGPDDLSDEDSSAVVSVETFPIMDRRETLSKGSALQKAIASQEPTANIINILNDLKVNIKPTEELLRATGIGKVVNKVKSVTTVDPSVQQLASEIISLWRHVLNEQKITNSGASTPNGARSNGKSQAVATKETPKKIDASQRSEIRKMPNESENPPSKKARLHYTISKDCSRPEDVRREHNLTTIFMCKKRTPPATASVYCKSPTTIDESDSAAVAQQDSYKDIVHVTSSPVEWTLFDDWIRPSSYSTNLPPYYDKRLTPQQREMLKQQDQALMQGVKSRTSPSPTKSVESHTFINPRPKPKPKFSFGDYMSGASSSSRLAKMTVTSDDDKVAAKRKTNTIAARESRKRKMEVAEAMETEIQRLRGIVNRLSKPAAVINNKTIMGLRQARRSRLTRVA